MYIYIYIYVCDCQNFKLQCIMYYIIYIHSNPLTD